MSPPISSRCSGAKALASSTVSLGVSDLDERECGLPDGRALDDQLLQAARQRRARLRGRRCGRDEASAAVLGLGEHVERGRPDLPRADRGAEEHEEVARAGEAVDAHARRDLELGLLYVEVAGAYDHIHGGDRLSAAGERADRLGAAHAVDALDSAQAAGAEDDGVDTPPRARRRAHRHVDHTGGAGCHDPHDDRARVGRAPAWDVHGGRADGHLPQRDPVALREIDSDIADDAGLGHEGDVRDRDLKPRNELRCEAEDRLVELLGRHQEGGRLLAGGVEPARAIQHGGIAPGAHGGEDLGHLPAHGGAAGDEAAHPRGRGRRPAEAPHLGRVEAVHAHVTPRRRRAGRGAARAGRPSPPP